MNIYEGLYLSAGLLVGLFLLWWSGNKSVKYAVKTTKVFGFGKFFIGFVLMAVTTGVPELAIALMSEWRGVSGLSVGDILGSNLHDISVIIAIPILLYGGFQFAKPSERKELLLSLLMAASAMALVFMRPQLGRWGGFSLILMYVIYLAWLAMAQRPVPAGKHAVLKKKIRKAKVLNGNSEFVRRVRVLGQLGASLGLVILAAQMCVHMAMKIVMHFGWSLEMLGASVFAFWTSIPELTVNLSCVKRGEYAMAIGNAIGSVFQQGTFILGIQAVIARGPLDIAAFIDMAPFMFACFVLLAVSIWWRKKLTRFEGVILFMFYLGFIAKRILL